MAVMRRANNEKINQQRWGGSNWRTIGTILGTAGKGVVDVRERPKMPGPSADDFIPQKFRK